jgi:hypothetical protein
MNRFLSVVLLVGCVGVFGQERTKQPESAVPPAVFTADQAELGRIMYRTQQPGVKAGSACVDCHLDAMTGKDGKPWVPPLAGPDFLAKWGPQSTRGLYKRIQLVEPLTNEKYLGLVAYILRANGAKAGPQALSAESLVTISAVTGR